MFEKRLLTAAIAVVLGIGLTACGSGSSSGSSDDVGSGVENPSPSVPGTGDGPGTTPEPGNGDSGATAPEPNPQPDPDPQPEPDPQPQPDPDPQPQPDPDPQPQPDPDPQPEPEPDPQPQPDPEPDNGAGDNGGQGPSAGTGSAAADCDLAAFRLQPGTRWHLEYQNRTVMGGKPVSGTQVHDVNVVQRTSFHGHSALELKHVTTVAMSGIPAVTNEGWTWQDVVGGNVVELYGHRTSTETMGIQISTESTYEPAWRDLKFTLRSGETANYTYTMKTVATTNAMGMETQNESSHSASGSWTYHGMESVAVPAGTFNTCKFTHVEDGTTNVEWLLPGQLIIVKSVSDAHDGSGEVRLDLTAGTFNGAALR